jgi:glucose-1-phosphate thymidylyltransferase
LEAAEFVATLERRQGMKIACPEEIAWHMGFIDDTGLERATTRLGKGNYATYLHQLLKAKRQYLTTESRDIAGRRQHKRSMANVA